MNKKIINMMLCITLFVVTLIPVNATEKSNNELSSKVYKQLQEEKYTGFYTDRNTGINQYYEKGIPASNKWITADSKIYYLKSNTEMAYKWIQLDNSWYYFDGFNGMVTGWHKDVGKWYYLGNDGKMLANTTTPDGYTVGSDGALI